MLKPEKRHVPMLSDEEEALLQEAVARDPNAAEATDNELAAMRPTSEVLPPLLYVKLVQCGRPKLAKTKTAVQLRLDPEIVEAFKSTGRGWQTRINAVLAEAAGALRQGGVLPIVTRPATVEVFAAREIPSAGKAEVAQKNELPKRAEAKQRNRPLSG